MRGPAAVQRVFELSQVDELLPFADWTGRAKGPSTNY